MSRRERQSRGRRRSYPEASYDEASRARYRVRASRPGGSGGGGSDHGFTVTRRVLLALFGVIAARLGWLQVVEADELSSRAESQRTNSIALHAKRGTIYDRNGNVLALSEDCETIYANPTEVEDASAVAAALAEALGGEESDYEDLIAQNSESTFVYVQRQVDQEVADELSKALDEQGLTGIYFLSDTKRVYPYGNVGAQILGHVNVDGEGSSGLEYYYDDILTGTDGQMLVETGLYGTPIAGGASQVTEAVDGTDIVISLDIDLQEACESIIEEAVEHYSSDSGSVMVTDPKTGEVLAACSTPLPDFSNLEDLESLNLKLVSSSYEPGSIFKVVTTAIGLEDGLFTPDSTYTVPAAVQVGESLVTDDDGRDYTMDMSVAEMLRRSSNAGLALLAQDVIGADAFSEGLERFGIGHATGIDFPGEVDGIVRDREDYDGSSLGSMAFGQGLAFPLVQMVRAYGAIANGGVPMTPHFLVTRGGEEVDWPAGDAVVSAEVAAEEVEMLRAVVNEGTAVNAAVDGYDVAGKTGTGEVAAEDGSGYVAGKFVASLAGFANADDPEVLAYVGLNGVSYLASASAASVFHDIMEQAVNILGVTPVS